MLLFQVKQQLVKELKLWPFTVLGGEPQDLKYDGEDGKFSYRKK